MPLPTEADAAQALAEYLDEDTVNLDAQVTAAAVAALRMVSERIGSYGAQRIPAEVGLEAVTEAGAAVYYRRTARNGITTFGGADVTPMRIAKDPLSTVYPMLAPYTLPGIA